MAHTMMDRRRALHGAAAAGALGVFGVAAARPASAASGLMGAGVASRRAAATTSPPVLQIGSRGAAVLDLQNKLSAAGYWLGAVDGDFGGMTQQAVWALQKYHGLSRDAVVGQQTWAKVDLRQRPTSRYGGTRIEIDKTRQLLLASSGGVVQMALNTSTGANKPFKVGLRWYDGKTPRGSFATFRCVPGWYYGPLGGLYRPMFFNGGIAIHGSASIPPYNASHGCCRLSTQARDRLLANGLLVLRRAVSVY